MYPLLAFSLLSLSLVTQVLSSPSGADKELNVSISVTYSPPSTFQQPPPYYRAASALTLTCFVDGASDGLYYEWSSSCDGLCFPLGETDQSVSTAYLESKDSGTHTCMVYDGLGCSGNANITINVVSAGIYVTEGHKSLPNNGVIVANNSTNRISEFRCLSGSKHSSVGHLIGVNGTDIIHDLSDPFLITRGRSKINPGMIRVRSTNRLTSDYEGVYTCRIPNENGQNEEVNVGLYQQSTAGPPVITGMGFSVSEPPYTVTCNSTGSPATKVIWTFNGKQISTESETGLYKTSKKLVDRHTSLYVSKITVDGSFEDVVGEYSCRVENELGASNVIAKEIKGLYITGNDKPIIVGLEEKINCSTLLNVTKIEWILVGIRDDPVEETTDSQTLTLPVSPQTEGLDGTMFTCRAVTVGGKVFEETITIQVKELDNFVKVSGKENPLLAGENYTIYCTVESDIAPTVTWIDGDGNTISGKENIIIDNPVVSGNTTVLRLTFAPLRTSHGGVYYCRSEVDHPPSVQQASRDIFVQIPPPTLTVIQYPKDDILYTTTQLNLTCVAEIHNVDDTTLVKTNSSWTGPAALNDDRISSSNETISNFVFESILFFSKLQSSDSGSYTCAFTATSPSTYIVDSETVSTSTAIRAALKVSITVSYTPPDQYPTYSTPNYRAASSVSLRCVVEGATGSVQYRWSSTCRSCFASSGYSSTISEHFLRSKDTGVHTCTVTDAIGNSGTYSEQMNIAGAGIYVSTASSYGGATTSQPNNTYIHTYTSRSYSIRFAIYCCSGSTSSHIGSFRTPSGYVKTTNYEYYTISHQSSSSSYAGCIYMGSHFSTSRTSTRTCSSRSYYGGCNSYTTSYSYPDDNWSPENGVYTCNIPDENGIMQHVGFTLYSSSSARAPYVNTLRRVSSGDALTLICVSRTAPPTNIAWTRDREPLDIDGKINRMTQQVTSRSSVIYENKLQVYDSLDNATGVYSCIIDNRNYYRRIRSVTIRGIKVTTTTSPSSLVVGQSVTFSCASDLDPTGIDWYRGETIVATSGWTTLHPVSTKDEGIEYKCKARSPYGTQKRSFTLQTRVPDNWATVEVANSSNTTALHGTNYTLTCTVSVINGLSLPVNIEWSHSNGSSLMNDNLDRILVERVNVSESVTILTLMFSPVLTTDGGDYTCRATVNVSWMDVQPPAISASVHMPVTTQALFQLKMGPVQYCVNWAADEPYDLETNIKQNIEDAIRTRCDCDFEDSAIYSGEFSCQTTTTSVTYRAIINGTSDLLTAQVLLDHVEDWRLNSGTLLHDRFRLRLARKEECALNIDSFNELECSAANKESAGTEYLRADYCYKLSAQEVGNSTAKDSE